MNCGQVGLVFYGRAVQLSGFLLPLWAQNVRVLRYGIKCFIRLTVVNSDIMCQLVLLNQICWFHTSCA